MNDISTVTQLINNVGFPIAVSVALFYQFVKTNDLMRDFQKTIVKHTTMIERLINIIEKSEKDV